MPKELSVIEQALISCRKCPRLVEWREEVARVKRRAYRYQDYWGKPVPGFGDPNARLLVLGLAPGAHGSNRTGRMFTGDGSGNFLYPALYRAGFATQPEATAITDGLILKDVFISAVCRCARLRINLPGMKFPIACRGSPRKCKPYLTCREWSYWERSRLRGCLACLHLLNLPKNNSPLGTPAFTRRSRGSRGSFALITPVSKTRKPGV